ncbi:22507_t:CDS:2 [Gigaspora margarita]|uniref:22507_t:CDS:1 n=1 Tax=Gigaspora margarita TaxID=4874 RepID=A0ABN7UWI0_GIGMA|nr:22507_t:CDS:2 [Gigaspora margarita]
MHISENTKSTKEKLALLMMVSMTKLVQMTIRCIMHISENTKSIKEKIGSINDSINNEAQYK